MITRSERDALNATSKDEDRKRGTKIVREQESKIGRKNRKRKEERKKRGKKERIKVG